MNKIWEIRQVITDEANYYEVYYQGEKYKDCIDLEEARTVILDGEIALMEWKS